MIAIRVTCLGAQMVLLLIQVLILIKKQKEDK